MYNYKICPYTRCTAKLLPPLIRG